MSAGWPCWRKCGRVRKPAHVLCSECWSLVPAPQQEAVNRAYREWQTKAFKRGTPWETRLALAQQYQDAATAAVAAIAEGDKQDQRHAG